MFRPVAIHNKESYDELLRRNPVIDVRDNPGIPLDRVARTNRLFTFLIYGTINPISRKTNPSFLSSKSWARGPLYRANAQRGRTDRRD